jgi:methylmalonyl-CoA/ethylmalonyl-CoA epimerase
MKFDHIGIIVDNILSYEVKFKKSLKLKNYRNLITDKKIDVKVKFFKDARGIKYELIEPISKKNPLNKIKKNKLNFLHHLAYKVKEFNKECVKFRNLGFAFLTKPLRAKAFKNNRIIFLMSKENFIIELIEDK